MKTYLIRDSKTVEPQNPLRSGPAVTATVETILGRSDVSARREEKERAFEMKSECG